jgi:hypothetical protein
MVGETIDPLAMVDTDRYPLADLGGARARAVIDAERRALFAYDERPDANSTDLFKLIRYGRAAPLAPET